MLNTWGHAPIMKKFLPALAIYFLCSLAVMQGAYAQSSGSGDVVIFIFDGDTPVEGASLLVDGKKVASTGDDGGIFTSLSAGRHKVIIERNGEQVVDLDLLTVDGEQVQLIATLKQGQKPEINIESTGSGPVLAQDAESQSVQPDQKAGLLKGTIVATGDAPVSDARVLVPSRGRATRTDENGVFQIELPPGNYSIEVSHPNYATQTLDNLRVISGKTVTADLSLGDAGVRLAEYVVTGTYIEGSVADELSIQRDSPQVVSVIGAEQIARTGDSDAAEALRRVSGLVIEQGKFVVVRGQPYRYSLTQFNGLPLPSPDPIIEAVPLTLFPSTVLSNIEVQKSYSVDKPGNFGAGLIGLSTRSVPDEPFFQVQASTGGNSFSTGKTGLTYEGSNEDFLGQDGGIRDLPDEVPSLDVLGTMGNSPERQQIGRSFNDLFLPQTLKLPADVGFDLVGGRSLPTDYGTYGFVATASYDHEYRRQTERNVVAPTAGRTPFADFTENRTDRNVQVSSLLGLSGTWDKHSITSNTFFIRDSQDRTQISEGFDLISNRQDQRRFLLEFQRRELRLTQLIGEHDFDFVRVNWRGQFADTTRDRPDRRSYTYQRTFGTGRDLIFFDDAALLREFNSVDENNNSGAVDLTFPLPEFADTTAELLVGGNVNVRERDSVTRRFGFEPRDGADLDRPFIEQIINDDTIDDDGDVVTFDERTVGTDIYTADTETLGGYVGTSLLYRDLVQVVAGLRQTFADYEVETANGSVGSFDEDYVLPAVSVTGFLTSSVQLRGAVGKTVAYPRLVELSASTFFDPDTGDAFVGNPNLKPTEITSYDMRIEWYPTAVEALTFGVFYKDLTNSIEEQFISADSGVGIATFVNGESADIIGVEFGGRMSLGRIFDTGLVPRTPGLNWLSQAYVQGDVTFTDSEVDVGANSGVATNQKRSLNGQADNTLNLQVGYDGPVHDFTLVYNRVGQRLDQAGVDGLPDIFQEPISSLDLTYTLTIPEVLPFIGKIPYVGNGQIKFKGRNLLNEEVEFLQGGELQRRIIFGRGYTASLKWNFF